MSSWNAQDEHGYEEIDAGALAAEPGVGADEGSQATAEFDALPVLAREQVLTPTYYRSGDAEPARPAQRLLPAMHSAAAAAGGFVAGALLISFVQRLVQRRHRRALARRASRRGAMRARKSSPPDSELLEVVASRSLLVDVHLLGNRR